MVDIEGGSDILVDDKRKHEDEDEDNTDDKSDKVSIIDATATLSVVTGHVVDQKEEQEMAKRINRLEEAKCYQQRRKQQRSELPTNINNNTKNQMNNIGQAVCIS